MEPNNFEEDFREKLNQRKIEPSDKAWDRLDAMLSVAEEKKPTVGFRSLQASKKKWLYIAASIVGFLLFSTLFFNKKERFIEKQRDNVVIEYDIQKDSIKKQNLPLINSSQDKIVIAEKNTNQKAEKSSRTKHSNQKSNQIIKKEVNQIAESSIINQKKQQSPAVNNQIAIPETPKNETPDQLLNSVDKKAVAESSAKPKAKIKVNASDLLNQVDGELELSFREKMITKVNKNYQTVKVALANRNQQE